MKKNLKHVYYRHPRTQAERRANQEGWERAKRRPHLLPTSYDDKYPTHEKCWKQKRKKQYHPNGRGEQHSIYVDDNDIYMYRFKEHLRDLNIPFRIEQVKESFIRKEPIWVKVIKPFKKPIYQRSWYKKDGKTVNNWEIIGWYDDYTWKINGYKMVPRVRIIGYNIIWWSNKDIGIEHMLNQYRPNWK